MTETIMRGNVDIGSLHFLETFSQIIIIEMNNHVTFLITSIHMLDAGFEKGYRLSIDTSGTNEFHKNHCLCRIFSIRLLSLEFVSVKDESK